MFKWFKKFLGCDTIQSGRWVPIYQSTCHHILGEHNLLLTTVRTSDQYHRLLYFLHNYKDAQAMVNGKVATMPKRHAMMIYKHIQNMNIEQRLYKSNLESLSNILPNSKSIPLNLKK